MAVGGPAKEVLRLHHWSQLKELTLRVQRGDLLWLCGSGTNTLFDDQGFQGLLVLVQNRDWFFDGNQLIAGAGWELDQIVSWATHQHFKGLAGLSGIPGTLGAAPIQNVGAYQQQLSDCLVSLVIWDLREGCWRELSTDDLDMGYRSSRLQSHPHWLVWQVKLNLQRGDDPILLPELQQQWGTQPIAPHLLRTAILATRQAKGMLLTPPPDFFSLGSFFKNPTVDPEVLRSLEKQIPTRPFPAFPLAEGLVKLSAAFLIEHAGFPRGYRRGSVGLSPFHALCLVNFGQGSAKDLRALAKEIKEAVWHQFKVLLEPEPILLAADGTRHEL
jgi:UDP-N-acetylmuramate dehydrogenase